MQLRNERTQTSLVVQWIRIRLPMQGTQVRSPVRENSTGGTASNPAHYNNEPGHLEPVLHDERGHGNGKPVHLNEGQSPLTATRESLHTAWKTQCSQKLISNF